MKKMILVFLLMTCSLGALAEADLSLYLGPSLSQSGDIEDLGKPEMNSGFEFNYFFNQHHGIGAGFGNEFQFEGSEKLPTLRDASIQTFDIHYAYKYRFQNSPFRITFTPGIAYQTLYKQSRDYFWGYFYYDSLSSAWALSYKLMFDFIIKEWDDNSNIFIGAGLNQIFSFDDDLYGRDISGNRLSAIFRFGGSF